MLCKFLMPVQWRCGLTVAHPFSPHCVSLTCEGSRQLVNKQQMCASTVPAPEVMYPLYINSNKLVWERLPTESATADRLAANYFPSCTCVCVGV